MAYYCKKTQKKEFRPPNASFNSISTHNNQANTISQDRSIPIDANYNGGKSAKNGSSQGTGCFLFQPISAIALIFCDIGYIFLVVAIAL